MCELEKYFQQLPIETRVNGINSWATLSLITVWLSNVFDRYIIFRDQILIFSSRVKRIVYNDYYRALTNNWLTLYLITFLIRKFLTLHLLSCIQRPFIKTSRCLMLSLSCTTLWCPFLGFTPERSAYPIIMSILCRHYLRNYSYSLQIIK